MPLILAIEPDKKQSQRIATIARGPLKAELVIAGTTEDALAALGARTPDLILTTQLLSPRDEAALDQRLHELDAAGSRVQTLVIPVLSGPARRARGDGGLLTRLRRPASDGVASHGCDPAIFAAQISEYLERAAAERAAALEEASDLEGDDLALQIAGTESTASVAPPEPALPRAPLEPAVVDSIPLQALDAPVAREDDGPDAFAVSLDADFGLSLDDLPEFELIDIDPIEDGHVAWTGDTHEEPAPADGEEDAWEELALPTVASASAQAAAPVAVAPPPLPVAPVFHAPQVIQAESIDLARFISEFTDDQDVDGEAPPDTTPEIQLHFAPPAAPTESGPLPVEPVTVSPPRQSEAASDQWMPPPASLHFWWPPLEGMSVEDPDNEAMATDVADTAAEAVASPPGPAVLEMLTAIRRDIELLRHGRDEAPADAHGREREATIRAMMPSFDTGTNGPVAAGVLAPPGSPDASHHGARKKAKRKVATTPPQDEWGFFDPEQCGFAALLAKLEEITESKANAADRA